MTEVKHQWRQPGLWEWGMDGQWGGGTDGGILLAALAYFSDLQEPSLQS